MAKEQVTGERVKARWQKSAQERTEPSEVTHSVAGVGGARGVEASRISTVSVRSSGQAARPCLKNQ